MIFNPKSCVKTKCVKKIDLKPKLMTVESLVISN